MAVFSLEARIAAAVSTDALTAARAFQLAVIAIVALVADALAGFTACAMIVAIDGSVTRVFALLSNIT